MIRITARNVSGAEVSRLLRAVKISGLHIIKKDIRPSN